MTEQDFSLNLEDLRPRPAEKRHLSELLHAAAPFVYHFSSRQVHGLRRLRDDLLHEEHRKSRPCLREREGRQR